MLNTYLNIRQDHQGWEKKADQLLSLPRALWLTREVKLIDGKISHTDLKSGYQKCKESYKKGSAFLFEFPKYLFRSLLAVPLLIVGLGLKHYAISRDTNSKTYQLCVSTHLRLEEIIHLRSTADKLSEKIDDFYDTMAHWTQEDLALSQKTYTHCWWTHANAKTSGIHLSRDDAKIKKLENMQKMLQDFESTLLKNYHIENHSIPLATQKSSHAFTNIKCANIRFKGQRRVVFKELENPHNRSIKRGIRTHSQGWIDQIFHATLPLQGRNARGELRIWFLNRKSALQWINARIDNPANKLAVNADKNDIIEKIYEIREKRLIHRM